LPTDTHNAVNLWWTICYRGKQVDKTCYLVQIFSECSNMLEALFSCFVLHFSIIFTRKALAIVRSPLHRSWYTKSINDCRSILSRSDILHTITACNRLYMWITDK
jgi:hypothetical protein